MNEIYKESLGFGVICSKCKTNLEAVDVPKGLWKCPNCNTTYDLTKGSQLDSNAPAVKKEK